MNEFERRADILERGGMVQAADDVADCGAQAAENTETVMGEGGTESESEPTAYGKDKGVNSVRLKCIKRGKENYIKAKPGVEVYDTRSKRRIGKENGKDNMIRVFLADRVVMKGYVYLVESIIGENVRLKKIGPVG